MTALRAPVRARRVLLAVLLVLTAVTSLVQAISLPETAQA